jgi:hypothetical protein
MDAMDVAETLTGGTLIGGGTYYYTVAYLDENGYYASAYNNPVHEPVIALTAGANTRLVTVTNIPVSADPRVKKRVLMRTDNLGGSGGYFAYRIATINDNTTTTFVDTGYALDLTIRAYRLPNKKAGLFKIDGVQSIFTSAFQTALGIGAGQSNTSGESWVAIGSGALRDQTTASNNNAIGYSAGISLTTGAFNNAFGYAAIYNITTGQRNCAFGENSIRALNASSNNSYNTAMGFQTQYACGNACNYNTSIGYQSMQELGRVQNKADVGNISLGANSAYRLTYNSSETSSYSIFIGYESGYEASSTSVGASNYNTCLGYQAGYRIGYSALSSKNILIGYRAGYAGSANLDGGDDNILIGNDVNTPAVTTSSYLNIGNALYGTALNSTSFKLGINTTAPDKVLEINSVDGNNLRLTYNDANGTAANYVDLLVSSTGDLTITPSGGDTTITGTLKATQFKLSALNTAPANATDTGVLGEIRIDAAYIYVCTATNTWVRAALATW